MLEKQRNKNKEMPIVNIQKQVKLFWYNKLFIANVGHVYGDDRVKI